jgi:hypothetical protein
MNLTNSTLCLDSNGKMAVEYNTYDEALKLYRFFLGLDDENGNLINNITIGETNLRHNYVDSKCLNDTVQVTNKLVIIINGKPYIISNMSLILMQLYYIKIYNS